MKNVAGILVAMAAVILLGSCRTTHEVEKVYVNNIDTLYKSVLVHDSVYVKDSTVIREKGDTIFSDRWHTKYIERLSTDTLYKYHTDTLRVTEVKEKELSRQKRLRMFFGDALITVLLVVLFWVAWKVGAKYRM